MQYPSQHRLMTRLFTAVAFGILAPMGTLAGQVSDNPLPPIQPDRDVIVVGAQEFASLPDHDGNPARMMLLVDEPGTGRLFVNDMYGPLYAVSYDGRRVTPYLDLDDAKWGVGVQAQGRERGFQSFAMHPDFGRQGAPGYGLFYTWSDTPNTSPTPDFRPGGGTNTHHTVLLEWKASAPGAAAYDGGAPREVMRFEQPFGNHNAGHLAFNPLASPGEPDYGMLYVGVADGGSGGDPLQLGQNMGSTFGKILRIDPLARTAPNGEYGVPGDNPHVGQAGVRGEIYASGLRNPQRFDWDPANGTLYVADIGQNLVEEISPVPAGGNLGWNTWEGSFRFVDRSGVRVDHPRSDPAMTYPVVEYDHSEPLMGGRVAVTGVHAVRGGPLQQLEGRVLFADSPSGEIMHFNGDRPPQGGGDGIGRVLIRQGQAPTGFLQIVQAKNRQQGRDPAERTDIRFGAGPDGRLFLLNKHDGIIREVTP